MLCTIQGRRAISVLRLVLDVCCPRRGKQLNGVKRCIKSPGPVSLMSYGCWLAQVLYQLAGTLHLSEQKCHHQHLNCSSVSGSELLIAAELPCHKHNTAATCSKRRDHRQICLNKIHRTDKTATAKHLYCSKTAHLRYLVSLRGFFFAGGE